MEQALVIFLKTNYDIAHEFKSEFVQPITRFKIV